MKITYLSIAFLLTIINCYSQDNKLKNFDEKEFINEYYCQFLKCPIPFYTQKIDSCLLNTNYFKKIPQEFVIKYIGNTKNDIEFEYLTTNFDTQESNKGIAKYDYYYLYKYEYNKSRFALYIKDQGKDSTLIYIIRYNSEFKIIDKLRLRIFIADNELTKSVINSDSTIIVFKYNPLKSLNKTLITISHYKINKLGEFEVIKIDQKEGLHDFVDYMGVMKNPDDDPMNQF